MRNYKRIVLAALAAAAIAAGAVTQGSSLAGDPSQWGAAKKGSFDESLAGSAGGSSKITRESAFAGFEPLIAGSAGASSKVVRESS